VHEDGPLQPPQVLARLEAEIRSQGSTSVPVSRERVSLAAAAVKREHELTPQALALGVFQNERPKLAYESLVPAEGEVGFDPVFDRHESQLFQAFDRGLGERLICEVREGRPAPQAQRQTQPFGRLGSRACSQGAAAFPDEALEPEDVDRFRIDSELVTARVRHEGFAREGTAETRNKRCYCVRGCFWRLVPPECVGEAIAGDHLIRAEEKDRE
jgi:hypothetical protein